MTENNDRDTRRTPAAPVATWAVSEAGPIFRVQRLLALLSDWIDASPANADRDPEAGTWGRLAKVIEEHGEVLEALIAANGAACGRVVAAYIGATGQNPRKGVTGTMGEVEKELYDVALTALCAVVHLHGGDPARVFAGLFHHIESVARRAGVEGADGE